MFLRSVTGAGKQCSNDGTIPFLLLNPEMTCTFLSSRRTLIRPLVVAIGVSGSPFPAQAEHEIEASVLYSVESDSPSKLSDFKGLRHFKTSTETISILESLEICSSSKSTDVRALKHRRTTLNHSAWA